VNLIVSILLEVSIHPDPSQLPGGGTLQDLSNGLLGWALILTVTALGFGASAWAVGAASGNMAWVERGKQAVVVAAIAALVEGAAAFIVNGFFGLGASLH
jgi:Family of unknown function (DUF6112)